MVWKIQKKIENKTGKIQKKSKLNSDKIWKIRRRVSRIAIRFGKYGRKAT
jgi:hypothetical protein